MTTEDYMSEFPGHPLRSKKSCEWMRDPEVNLRRGRSISKALKGHIKTPETIKRLSEGAKRQWERMTPSERKAFTSMRAERCRRSERFRATHAAVLNDVRPTPEEQSWIMTDLIESGLLLPHYRSVPTMYKNILMDSQTEALLAERLDGLSIEWEYHPCQLKLKCGKCYTPDFYLPNLDKYVEVKGFLKKGASQQNLWKAYEVGAVVVTRKMIDDEEFDLVNHLTSNHEE